MYKPILLIQLQHSGFCVNMWSWPG